MNIDTKTAKGFREYFKEYVIMALCICVITLFGLYYNLNNYIIHTLSDRTEKMEIIIEKNTEAIQLLRK
jgi:hypothetical protein